MNSATLAVVAPALDRVYGLQPGRGWVSAEIDAGSGQPFTLGLEAGTRFNPFVAGYGRAWLQPIDKKYGADLGLRIGSRTDIYAGGTGTYAGEWTGQAGVKFRW